MHGAVFSHNMFCRQHCAVSCSERGGVKLCLNHILCSGAALLASGREIASVPLAASQRACVRACMHVARERAVASRISRAVARAVAHASHACPLSSIAEARAVSAASHACQPHMHSRRLHGHCMRPHPAMLLKHLAVSNSTRAAQFNRHFTLTATAAPHLDFNRGTAPCFPLAARAAACRTWWLWRAGNVCRAVDEEYQLPHCPGVVIHQAPPWDPSAPPRREVSPEPESEDS